MESIQSPLSVDRGLASESVGSGLGHPQTMDPQWGKLYWRGNLYSFRNDETQCHLPQRSHATVKKSMNENFSPQMTGAKNFELPKLYGFFHSDLKNY